MTVRVIVALPERQQEEAVIRRLGRADAGCIVVRRCSDIVDVRSAVASTAADAVIIDSRLRGLDTDVVVELHAQRIRVILVDTRPNGSVLSESSARATLGSDATVFCEPEQILAALRGIQPPPIDGYVAELPAAGKVIAIWGPIGSPGRSVVAVNLADELSRLKLSTALADADTYGPSIAQQLGLLDDMSGLAAACRLAGQGGLTVEALARTAVELPSGLRVLTGVPRSDRWQELRPAALDAVWQCARQWVANCIVDIGFCLEHDELAWFEPGLPSRNQSAVATLATADTVVAVTSADPVGLVRLLRSMPEVRTLAPTAKIFIVVNRAPTGRTQLQELRQLLVQHTNTERVLLVPDDRKPTSDALRTGQTLAEAAPRSSVRRAIQALAHEVVGVAPVPRRGRSAA